MLAKSALQEQRADQHRHNNNNKNPTHFIFLQKKPQKINNTEKKGNNIMFEWLI